MSLYRDSIALIITKILNMMIISMLRHQLVVTRIHCIYTLLLNLAHLWYYFAFLSKEKKMLSPGYQLRLQVQLLFLIVNSMVGRRQNILAQCCCNCITIMLKGHARTVDSLLIQQYSEYNKNLMPLKFQKPQSLFQGCRLRSKFC